MYNVYFDNILQDAKDIININDSFETSIVREDGFNNQRQIIREKSDAMLKFGGNAYSFVCNTLKENPCHVFNVRIEDTESDYKYNATMSVIGMKRDIIKCVCITDLKDNSFSAYIDGYLNNKVSLFNTKTKNCEDILVNTKLFKMPYNVSSPTLYKIISGFDVLDVMKFIINYYTDNTINILSDYLTDNKYAITTGFSMHNHGFAIAEKYPELSFNDIFEELRKKLAIYMAIEYDEFNNPYLRVEHESYFFSDEELFSIDVLPIEVTQEYDNKRNFNQISIGSKDTNVLEDTPITYPQLRYKAWNEEGYGKCGSCLGEKDSVLNLVSDYIIDSNVIIEALIFDIDTDYENDSSIFLWNYEVVSNENLGVFTLDAKSSKYYYNESIRNENVLANFIQYYRECIEIQRQSSYGFLATKDGQTLNVTDVLGYVQNYVQWQVSEYFIDNQDSLSNVTHDFGAGADNLTIFKCQLDNSYNFKSQALNLYQRETIGVGANNPTANVTYTLHVRVYSDDTFGTLLNTYTDTGIALNSITDKIDLTVETGLIPLVVDNVVCCELIVSYPVGSNPTDVVVFEPDLMSFELIDDSDSCVTVNSTQDTYPYVTTFEYPVSYSQYKNAINNKNGCINVIGYKHWIKDFKYKHGKKSTLILMTNDLICGCN